jgi:hypothetical protein
MYRTNVQEVSGFCPTYVLNLEIYSQTFEMLHSVYAVNKSTIHTEAPFQRL